MTQSADSPSSEKLAEIRGHRIPKRRFTRWALYYFMLYIVLPVLSVSLLADALLYFLFTRFTGHCYALFCLFN
ncbi:hypothetical protein [Denitrobaculum tricleocarpae]|uniref:Uncharacterized protein n=1 Tax=Denitrobaculum tricleocarpae TaxID=2591009 RepID=A0A545TTJ6_9PROT|nr:hypothetical protein [Denitrobaculum tricleocarpae]TQV80540.1 hypothetical protein FKG95_10210 [Denitrobaculum tricleocarpae]